MQKYAFFVKMWKFAKICKNCKICKNLQKLQKLQNFIKIEKITIFTKITKITKFHKFAKISHHRNNFKKTTHEVNFRETKNKKCKFFRKFAFFEGRAHPFLKNRKKTVLCGDYWENRKFFRFSHGARINFFEIFLKTKIHRGQIGVLQKLQKSPIFPASWILVLQLQKHPPHQFFGVQNLSKKVGHHAKSRKSWVFSVQKCIFWSIFAKKI